MILLLSSVFPCFHIGLKMIKWEEELERENAKRSEFDGRSSGRSY